MALRPIKRSLTISQHRTSISLEQPFWDALNEIAREKQFSVSKIVAHIDDQREGIGLSSAIRLFVLDYYRNKSST